MKRNIVLDANIEYNEMQRALYLAISYAARMPNVANPSVAEGFVFSYGDKNIFVKKLKQK